LGNTQLLVGRAGGYSSNYTADISGSLYCASGCVLAASGGYVGIGTTNPGYTLDVNGFVHCNSISYLDGDGILGSSAGSSSNPMLRIGNGSSSYFGSLRFYGYRNAVGSDYTTTELRIQKVVDSTFMQSISFIGTNNISLGGNVGIGTTNPAYPLHINGYNGSVSYSSPAISTYNLSSTGGQFYATNNYGLLTTIFSAQGVYSGLGFIQASDERIKENIEIVDVKNALSLVSKITPKTYTRADKLRYGSKREYGFIAQELETIIPECVTFVEETIPNIYDRATVSNGTIIELTTKSTNLFEKDASGNIFTKIKYYDASNNDLTTNIVSIIDDKTFIVTDLIDSSFVFIFGQKVNNFRSLDKNMIFTITTAAVKEIDRELQEAKQTIQTQQSQIHELQTENTDLKSRLAAIEARLSAANL
jgi:ribosomal protein L14E/L6E/L27E